MVGRGSDADVGASALRLQDFDAYEGLPTLLGVELLPGVTMSTNALDLRPFQGGIFARPHDPNDDSNHYDVPLGKRRRRDRLPG